MISLHSGTVTFTKWSRCIENQRNHNIKLVSLTNWENKVLNKYFNILETAKKSGVISAAEFKDLLLKSNRYGFTPMHQAMECNNTYIIRRYFSFVENSVNENVMTTSEYKNLMLCTNNDGFAPTSFCN